MSPLVSRAMLNIMDIFNAMAKESMSVGTYEFSRIRKFDFVRIRRWWHGYRV